MSLLDLSVEQHFPHDYATAQQRFRDAAMDSGWQLETHGIEERGPNGEALTTDVAISPDSNDATATLVVSSGVHGVEGFLGSAVQHLLLSDWKRGEFDCGTERPRVRYVFIHAVNPYGFAWLRRFDQRNIDLNRNFLLPDEAYRGCPDKYAQLDPLLNPQRPPANRTRWFDTFYIQAVGAIIRYGMPALRQAVAGGQYEYPRGLFFGGDAASTSQQLLTPHWDRWLGQPQRVVHLDFHTGLGRSGTHQLLLDYPLTDLQRDRLTHWFGSGTISEAAADNTTYSARGSWGRWCVTGRPYIDYLYTCAEFGTYSPLRVLAGLRAENQAHQWGRPESEATRRAKFQLRELFCPQSPTWRRQVLSDAKKLVDRAAVGLQNAIGR